MIKGPSVTVFTQRLQQCPHVFLSSLQFKEETSGVNTAALVSDLLLSLGGKALDSTEAAHFIRVKNDHNKNFLQIVTLSCWVLQDDWFRTQQLEALIRKCLQHKWLLQLGAQVSGQLFYTDSIRREELVRILLHLLEVLPQDENENYAMDRLKTLDSLEEKMILEQTQEARQRVLDIRKALAKKAAEEAASKMTRE